MEYNHKTIRQEILQNYFVRNGEVYAFGNSERIMNEDIRIQVMLAAFLYDEARKAASKSDVPLDEIIDREVLAFGINGDHNELVQNVMVWKIVESEGEIGDKVHIEEEYIDDTLTGNKYDWLTGPNKPLGLAVVRYLARQKGFDIGFLNATIHTDDLKETKKSKITIDFKKVPVLAERLANTVGDREYFTPDSLRETEEETKKAKRVPYWINPDLNLNNKIVFDPEFAPAAPVQSEPEQLQEELLPAQELPLFNLGTNVQVATGIDDGITQEIGEAQAPDIFDLYDQLDAAVAAGDKIAISYFQEEIKKTNPEYHKYLKVANKQYMNALIANDLDKIAEWQEALDFLQGEEYFATLERPSRNK